MKICLAHQNKQQQHLGDGQFLSGNNQVVSIYGKPEHSIDLALKPSQEEGHGKVEESLSDWLDKVVVPETDDSRRSVLPSPSPQNQTYDPHTLSEDMAAEPAYELRNPLGVDAPQAVVKPRSPSSARMIARNALKVQSGLSPQGQIAETKPARQTTNSHLSQAKGEMPAAASPLPARDPATDRAILDSLNNLAGRLDALGQQMIKNESQAKTEDNSPSVNEQSQKKTGKPLTRPELPRPQQPPRSSDDASVEQRLEKLISPLNSQLSSLARQLDSLSQSKTYRESEPAQSFQTSTAMPAFAAMAERHEPSYNNLDIQRQLSELSAQLHESRNLADLDYRLQQLDSFQQTLQDVATTVSHLTQRESPIDLAPLQSQIADLKHDLVTQPDGESLTQLDHRLGKLERMLEPLTMRLGDMHKQLAKGAPEEYYRLEQMILEMSALFEPVRERFDNLEKDLGERQKVFTSNFSNLSQKLAGGDQRFSDLESQIKGLSSRLERPLPPDPHMVKGFHEKLDDLQSSLNSADQRLEVLGSFEQSLRDMVGLLERSTSVANNVAERVADKVLSARQEEDERQEMARAEPLRDLVDSLNSFRHENQEKDRQILDQMNEMMESLNKVNQQISEARQSQMEYEAFERTREQAGNAYETSDPYDESGQEEEISAPPPPADDSSAGNPRARRKSKKDKQGLASRLVGKSKNKDQLDPELVQEAKIRAEHASRKRAGGDQSGRKKKKNSSLRYLFYLIVLGGLAWYAHFAGYVDLVRLGRNLFALSGIHLASNGTTDYQKASLNPQSSGLAANRNNPALDQVNSAVNKVLASNELPEALSSDSTSALTSDRQASASSQKARSDVVTTASLGKNSDLPPLPLPRQEASRISLNSQDHYVTIAEGIPEVPFDLLTDRLRAALINKDPNAMLEMGHRLVQSQVGDPQWQAAKTWYKMASDQGLPMAHYEYARALEESARSESDIKKAYIYYLKAAEAGNIKSMQALGLAYAKGIAGRKSQEEAAHWFRQAAEHGLVDGQYNFAILSSRGYGVSRDLIEAYKWFSLAEQAGDREARTQKNDLVTQMSSNDVREGEVRVANWTQESIDPVANEIIPPPGGW